jgi:hypothetical protein
MLKQEAGPGLVFLLGGTTMVKFKMMLCMIGIILNSAGSVFTWMKQKLPILCLEYLDWLIPPEEDNYKHIYEGFTLIL